MSDDLIKVKEIIAQSGNTFHGNVLRYFQDHGWEVLISPYYNDNISNKPREIDLIAEKSFELRDNFNEFFGTVNVKLFIECKYISQKTVFWFHDKDKQKAEDLVVETTPMPPNNSITRKHHYIESSASVAKLFADERKKNQQTTRCSIRL